MMSPRALSGLFAALALAACAAGAFASDQLPSPTVPAAAVVPDAGYRLYPGDLLRIEVFDHPDLTTQLRVPVSGTSAYPLIGDIGTLANRPLSSLQAELRRRLEADYLQQAIITATIVEFGTRFAYVLGSVKKPDAVPLHPLRTTTAMQAIAQAGGFEEDANRATAQVVRDDPAQPGTKLALAIPATDKAGALAADIPLLPGDVVIVPRLDRVYVIGKVTRPGAINLPSQEKLTVSKAISLAGGFDKFAVQDGVQLVRTGSVTTIDVKGLLSGKQLEDPVLTQGDTVYVPEARF
jgi:polysaccharide export outer membrane protein